MLVRSISKRVDWVNPYFRWFLRGRLKGRDGRGGPAVPEDVAANPSGLANAMFTVCIACCQRSDELIVATAESVLRQNYRNFEILLLGRDDWQRCLELAMPMRGLFCEPHLDEQAVLSAAVAAHVRGDYILLLHPGDQLEAHALAVLNRATNMENVDERPGLLVFDSLTGVERVRRYLPGLDADLIAHGDYIKSACALSRDLLIRISEGVQFTSLHQVLQVVANGNDISRHVPEALVSLRNVPELPRFSNLDATEAGGVSIIIPSRNRPDLLLKCTAFLRKLRMPFQLVVVDNGSDDPGIEDVYNELRAAHGAAVLRMNHEFNYSRMINLGVRSARYEYLLFLNNDVFIDDPAVVTTAVSYAAQSGIGVVGSVLRYPDGAVQHAGMVFWQDPDGTARSEHVLRHEIDRERACFGALSAPRQWQAVTGAFQVVRKTVFKEVGGYDDCNLPIEYNDVDFCFRVRAAGLRVVCLPFHDITHDESSTRSSIDAERNGRMRQLAQSVMRARWSSNFRYDPFLNPELRQQIGFVPADDLSPQPTGARGSAAAELKSIDGRAPAAHEAPRDHSELPLGSGLWRPRRLSPGICIAGFLNSEIGLGEAARNLGRAADDSRIPTTYLNRPLPKRSNDTRFETFFQTVPDRLATVSVEGLTLNGYDFNDLGQGRLRILYPFWELPHIPRGAYAMLNRYDELWAASEFIASALREAVRRPVRLVPQPLEVPDTLPPAAVPQGKLRFLTYFDYDSFIDRKNPLAAISAFCAAFPKRDDVELVVKARGIDEKGARRLVGDAAARDERIRLIDATLSREQMNALLSECHVFVSLHRSEGFGFGAAEALALGKVVIATGWSATNDFVTPQTGYLVDYRLRAVKESEYVHAEGQVWADPLFDAAVAQFHAVADDPRAAAMRAREGHALLLRRNSFAAVGPVISQALREIGAL